ncbi:MAG: YdcF family protein [Acidobacteria bacterium]|nr:YdcF family protein [Acidobacteriota bacterium]
MRRAWWIASCLALLAAAGVLLQTVLGIRRQSYLDEARPADVILVLGAAEYRGRPSPVLKARLDHGLELYRRRLAPRILTTGGAGGDPVFTEAAVGRDFLRQRGVPAEAIIVEAEGESTLESAVAAAEIMRRMGLKSCVVVSDGYHVFRAKKILEARGLVVHGSPRPGGNSNPLRQWWLCLRQAAGYWLWRVGIGL